MNIKNHTLIARGHISSHICNTKRAATYVYLNNSGKRDRRNLLIPLLLFFGRRLPLELDHRLGERGRKGGVEEEGSKRVEEGGDGRRGR